MIRIEGLNFTVGSFSLREVTLHVRPGEYFVLLGKPGSGKTVLLECIAGLNRPSSGTIEIGGRRVENVEPRDRGIGYVPQDYALFSAQTVRGNIEFALRVRRYTRLQRTKRVEELAEMLGIGYLLGRCVEGLSGGERQRVALARALAIKPGILLLDEPVSALDYETRDGILSELRAIQRQTGTTTMHVCHDLDEMRAVAGRVGVLHQGRLIQAGTFDEISRFPAHPEAARLFRLGTILSGTGRHEDAGSWVDFRDFAVRTKQVADGECLVLIRAREVRLQPPASHGGVLLARVESILWRDSTVLVNLKVGSTLFRAELPHADVRRLSLKEGSEIAATCPPEAVCVFPPDVEKSFANSSAKPRSD